MQANKIVLLLFSAAVNIRPFILKQILAQGKYIVLDPGNCPFKRNQILDIYEYKEERDKYENDFFAVTGKSGILKIIQNSGFEGVTKYRDIAIALGVSQNIIAGLSSGINYKYEDLEIKNLLKAKLMTLAESLDEKPVIDIPSITPSPISKYMWYMLGLKESVPIDCLLVRGLSYSISDEDKECFYNLILSLGDSRQKASDMLNDKVYEMVIEELDLSVRAFNCLKRHGINTVGDLVSMNESGLKDIRNLGEKCIEEIIHKLALMGLVLESSD